MCVCVCVCVCGFSILHQTWDHMGFSNVAFITTEKARAKGGRRYNLLNIPSLHEVSVLPRTKNSSMRREAGFRRYTVSVL